MGMDRKVVLSKVPAWVDWTALLAARGLTFQIRMIDGELAFPDEVPHAEWRELRLSVPTGMLTVLRETDGARVVTWGNAAGNLLDAWNAVAWALARAGGGHVETDQGPLTADDFAARHLE